MIQMNIFTKQTYGEKHKFMITKGEVVGGEKN